MTPGARTPEELETLLEDAFVNRDTSAIAPLFEEGAVVARGGSAEARGGEEIVRLATAMWRDRLTYLANPTTVLQARDTALVVARGGINVVRRGGDGAWRFAISLLDETTERKGK